MENTSTVLTPDTGKTGDSTRNIFDYIAEEKETFSQKPLCMEDSVVFTQLAYLRMAGYVKAIKPYPSFSTSIKDLNNEATLGEITKTLVEPEKLCRLIAMAAESPRFSGTRIKYFEEHTDLKEEKQFAAMTFLLDNHTAFVAFRGTDNTIVGWRENFNMAYMTPIPSQAQSAEYLRTVINRLRTRSVYVGGHSKGGNLAVYAAMHCGTKEQRRILGVYNLDGPGFKDDIVSSREMQHIKDRLYTILPESSMIGTLLKSVGWQMVVASRGKGFEQHDPFNWIFEGDHFKVLDSLSRDAIVFDRVLDKWLEGVDNTQRALIVDTMFKIINDSGADTFRGALKMIQDGDISALKLIKDMDPEKRRRIIPLIKDLGVEYIKEKMRRQ